MLSRIRNECTDSRRKSNEQYYRRNEYWLIEIRWNLENE